MLHLNGHDTMDLPLTDRKQLLKELLPDSPHFQYCDHIKAMEQRYQANSWPLRWEMEGVIAKKADSKYEYYHCSPKLVKI